MRGPPGAHLEGPFISPNRLGAQPPFPRLPDPHLAERWLSLAPVRVVTLAPELPGSLELVRFLAGRGVRVQMGHTAASYAEALAALEAGAVGFTHLYNAMTPLHHREPGAVGLALERGLWAELIPDGLHVHPAALRLALKSIPGLYFVTDAWRRRECRTGSTPWGPTGWRSGGRGCGSGRAWRGAPSPWTRPSATWWPSGFPSRKPQGGFPPSPPATWAFPTGGRSPPASGPTWWCLTRTSGWRPSTWGQAGGPRAP